MVWLFLVLNIFVVILNSVFFNMIFVVFVRVVINEWFGEVGFFFLFIIFVFIVFINVLEWGILEFGGFYVFFKISDWFFELMNSDGFGLLGLCCGVGWGCSLFFFKFMNIVVKILFLVNGLGYFCWNFLKYNCLFVFNVVKVLLWVLLCKVFCRSCSIMLFMNLNCILMLDFFCGVYGSLFLVESRFFVVGWKCFILICFSIVR